MEQIFLAVLNMSITGSYVIAFVMFVRLFLKRVPKIFSYSLWSIVLVRLMIPFSFSSAFSFLGLFKINTTRYIPFNIGYMNEPQIDVGIGAINKWANNSLPGATSVASVNPMQVILFVSSLVWVSFILMSQDMEMSCDEYVLKGMGTGIKKEYSNSLLIFATSGSMIKGGPLAFGESNTRGRIENVLNYKKPTFWVALIGVIMVIVIGTGLLSNPKNNKPDLSFLNINNTASVTMQQNQVLIKHGSQTSLVSGDEFGTLLDLSSNNWQEKKAASPYELSPDLTVYINIGSRHEVRFYESEPRLAMVLFDGKYRYYKIPADLYEKVYMMWAKSSYMVPEEMMSALSVY